MKNKIVSVLLASATLSGILAGACMQIDAPDAAAWMLLIAVTCVGGAVGNLFFSRA